MSISDSAKKIVKTAVDDYKTKTDTPGIAVAVYDKAAFGKSGWIYCQGLAHLSHPVSDVTGDTVFVLGSLTKVFTATLLGIPVVGGTVSLTDTVPSYLGVEGSSSLQKVTLQELATHTSGMARTARVPHPGNNLFAGQPADEKLKDYWGRFPSKSVGEYWCYSDIAFVTLGFAVTAMYPTPQQGNYPECLKQQITTPLDMKHTGPQVQSGWKFAKGYIGSGNKPAKHVASDLKSNAKDMLVFIKASLGLVDLKDHPLLAKSIKLTQTNQGVSTTELCPGKTDSKQLNFQMGLAWQISNAQSGEPTVYSKDGATNGFTCYMGFILPESTNPEQWIGIAVLTNKSQNPAGYSPTKLGQSIMQQLLALEPI
jgi:beta-lactamase class C